MRRKERTVMQRRSLTLLAAAVIGLAASQASAADLPRRAPAPAYVPPPAPLPYLWTGCYLGVNLGYAQADFEVTNVVTGQELDRTRGGFAGGGQIGCDYQMGAWVIGIRNMFDGTSIRNNRAFNDGVFNGTVEGHVRWFDALTGRVGYLLRPNLLFYGQGGAAWTSADLKFFDNTGVSVGEISKNKTGWTAGFGFEWMFLPHWSVFTEYNFMGFGTRSATVIGCGGSCAFSGKADIQNILVGVNYKF
jgi:outer membrane immunogenic protein